MPTKLPPPYHDSGCYAEIDATVIDEAEEIPIDDLLEEPFEEPSTVIVAVCPACGKPL